MGRGDAAFQIGRVTRVLGSLLPFASHCSPPNLLTHPRRFLFLPAFLTPANNGTRPLGSRRHTTPYFYRRIFIFVGGRDDSEAVGSSREITGPRSHIDAFRRVSLAVRPSHRRPATTAVLLFEVKSYMLKQATADRQRTHANNSPSCSLSISITLHCPYFTGLLIGGRLLVPRTVTVPTPSSA